ncbi:sialidase family protein [Gemmatimonas sp.]|uniref:sialidase family protein n=1 Tax=Gemmatimonas sp. TaxID=1962908 RepID=UPI00286E2E06|nr:sialidase family protein [Gemmatimonas sp.]
MRALRTVHVTLMGAVLLSSTALSAQSPIATLAVAERTGANPTVAAHGVFVAVAFSAATISSMDIFVATSTNGGTTFGLPVQVNRVAGEARVSGEEPPRVALVPRRGTTPEIVIVWTAKAGTTWKLLSARSLDGGRTFSASTPVPGSDREGSRGWQSVAVDATGRISVLWLDHRDLIAADAAHQHSTAAASGSTGATAAPMAMPKGDPTERAALSQLMFISLGSTRALSVARSVCYCCKTAMAVSGDAVYAAWRHVYPSGERDIAFTLSTNRGRTFATPVRVSDDHWKLDGCPDNGPALAIDATKRAHVVWPTASEGRNATAKDAMALSIYYAVSRDGKAFSARTRVPTRGPASHPQIVMLPNGTSLVAWDEVVDGTRRLGLARATVSASGAVSFTPVAAPDAGPGQWYPSLAASSGGAVITWVRQLERGSTVAVAVVR